MTVAVRSYWWLEPQQSVHESISAHINWLESQQSYRSQDNLRNMRLYGNLDVLGMGASSYSRLSSPFNFQNRLTFNIIQSICDTATNKITKNRPKPTFLTKDGNYTLQTKAKKLDAFIQGLFYQTDAYSIGQKIFRDATIFGTGFIKVFNDSESIKYERVFPDEIKVDDMESIYGTPRQIHQVKYIDKDVLIDQFPKFKREIKDAEDSSYMLTGYSAPQNQVRVVESWHLKSGPNATDGRKVISIGNVTLDYQEYNKDYFPFVTYRWSDRLLGFFGQGLSEQLTGMQLEINKILRTIQLAMHLCSVPRYLVEVGSKVNKGHINNDVGTIVTFSGTPPRLDASNAVPTELFAHLDRLVSRAYEIAGISQLSASAKKPAGLDAAVALREYNDIESERFMLAGQAYEKVFIDLAKMSIDQAREIYKSNGSFKINAKGKKFLESIDWGEVDLEDDQYILQIFPTSSLPNTPAGKLQRVQELMQSGLISKEQGLQLLDYPDLESYTSSANAAIENIQYQIERILDKGEYSSPEPYQNLQLGLSLFQSHYLKARDLNVPEEKLELMRRWMEEASALLTPPMQPLPEASMPQQPPSPAGATQPVSDLMPPG